MKTPEEAAGVDLLLVATKYGALQAALPDIEVIVDGHTIVMSLLNGVDSEEIIGARIGMKHMVYSLMKIASERVGSSIVFDGPSTIGLIYGEAGRGETDCEEQNRGELKHGELMRKGPSERCLAIAKVLEGTKLHYQISDDIIRQIWIKYALNVSQNQPQAMIGCGVGAYDDSVYAREIRDRLREEVVQIAKAKGIDISEPGADVGARSQIKKKARFSTLQDLDAKRHTEVDMFAGSMMKMGRELGIPTPYNEFTYNMIKALEEKNDGKFDY